MSNAIASRDDLIYAGYGHYACWKPTSHMWHYLYQDPENRGSAAEGTIDKPHVPQRLIEAMWSHFGLHDSTPSVEMMALTPPEQLRVMAGSSVAFLRRA